MTRRTMLLGWVLLSFVAGGLPAVAGGDDAASGVARALLLSDLHFDPFVDAGLVPRLVAAPVEEWAGILGEGSGVMSAYGEDADWTLVASSFDAAARRLRAPEVVIVTGDFLAHEFREKFTAAGGADDDAAYRSIVDKTVAFLTHELRRRFPGTPIVPVLGNNDSYCGDYWIEPGGDFLARTAETWGRLLDPGEAAGFATTFRQGGWYATSAPDGALRLLVLDTVLWSAKYENHCGDAAAGAAAGDAQLAWLEGELARAAAAGEPVWLLFHVPPGLDVYATLAAEPTPTYGAPGEKPPVLLLQERFDTALLDLLARHATTVAASLGAHVHRDGFLLVGATPGVAPAAAMVHLVPSVSPVYDNNPAFQVAEYDPATGRLLDLSTEILDLAAGNPGWKREDDFADAYGVPDLGPAALTELWLDLLADPDGALAAYARRYSTGYAEPDVGPCTWPAYWAAMGNPGDADAFHRWRAVLSAGLPESCSAE